MFFIVGRGRSGTDLLQSIINTHPDICMPPESSLITFIYRRYGLIKVWNDKILADFCKDVFKEEKIPNWWKIKQEELLEHLISNRPNNFTEALETIFRFYAKANSKGDAKHIGIKDPAQALYIKWLVSIFPDAKFICLHRDPVDNVFSFTNVEFDSKYISVLARRWNIYNLEILKYKKKYPDNFLTVHFEDLIHKTDDIITRICSFLEIENRIDASKKVGGDNAWQSNLNKPISADQLRKGYKNLSPQDVALISTICFKTAKALGYNLKKGNAGIYALGIYARLITLFEKNIFKLPLSVSNIILKRYRKKTKVFLK